MRDDPCRHSNPTASAEAIIRSGKARFTLLSAGLIRLEYGTFCDYATLSVVNRLLPVPQYQVSGEGKWLIVRSSALELRYKKGSGKFAEGNLRITVLANGSEWHPGETDEGNLLGTTRTLDETEGAGTVHLELGLLSRSGWTLLDDSVTPLLDSSGWVLARSSEEQQDWYFFAYGNDYLSVLKDFSSISGRMALPPRYAFGYWWSRYWAYSDAELRDLAEQFDTRGLPLDVLVIDMDWHDTRQLSYRKQIHDAVGELVGWTGYSWNKELFPEPRKLLDWLHQRGIRVAVNLHPASGIQPWEEHYGGFRQALGQDSTEGKTIAYALQDEAWARAYLEHIIEPLRCDGVDFFWLDWQSRQEVEDIPGLNNTWWLNHVFYNYMRERGEGRPLLFHRYGGLGNQRYPIGFSGDTWISWKSLSYLPYFTSTAGNVLYGYWSHDIGGHMGVPGSPELYLRWVQYGVFSPILRTHATKSAQLERRIWHYPELEPMLREALLLRQKLIPYIYTMAHKAWETGIALCRPLYWNWPEHEEAYANPQEYLFGDELLVAPVTSPADECGLVKQRFWVPPGEWFDAVHGCMVKGNSYYERFYALGEIPLLVRCGALIPTQEDGRLVWEVYPGKKGEARLYEDAGDSDAYLNGEFALTRCSQAAGKAIVSLRLDPRRGSYAAMPQSRKISFRLHGFLPPKTVHLNGTELAQVSIDELSSGGCSSGNCWAFWGADLTTLIQLTETDAEQAIAVQIEGVEYCPEQFLGILSRLPQVMEELKTEMNRVDAIANLPALIQRYGSFVSRLSYTPGRAQEEQEAFLDTYPEFIRTIAELDYLSVDVREKAIRQLCFRNFILPRPSLHIEETGVAISAAECYVPAAKPIQQRIRYTLDGSLPDDTSPLYRKDFLPAHTCQITARAFGKGVLPSLPSQTVYHQAWAESVSYVNAPAAKYSGLGDNALIDGSFGVAEDIHSHWLGFEGVDAVFDIRLLPGISVRKLALRFLRKQNHWIFLPVELRIEASEDGVTFRTIWKSRMAAVSSRRKEEAEVLTLIAELPSAVSNSTLRITAVNLATCPAWHQGAGGKAWIFIDELYPC